MKSIAISPKFERRQIITIRRATAEDFRAYTGRDPNPLWCAKWEGFVAERDSALIGFGVVSHDDIGRVWVWLHVREPLSAVRLHRRVRRKFAELRDKGETALHAYCDPEHATAERWLGRLGFRPDPSLPTHNNRPVWTCILSR